jgi:CheY-like chemotaxis protein
LLEKEIQQEALRYSEKTCLVIEDEPDLREILKDILEGSGLKCTVLSEVWNMELSIVGNFDLLISDIRLGANQPSGLQFLQQLRENNIDIPVIMISGFSAEGVEECLETKAPVLFLKKPFQTAQILNKVEEIFSLV